MGTLLFRVSLAAFVVCLAAADDQTPRTRETRKEVVVVTGTYEPIRLEDSDRSVTAVAVRELSTTAATLADVLRLDPSVDLQQRAPGAVQSGVSIRGGTFGQTLVLLNGFRLNDVQSANHNMDVPVPFETVARMEVLRGSGSTLYGSDAIAGVVNFITEPPEVSELRLRTAVGNFGANQQWGTWTIRTGKFAEQVSFARDFSSGFRENRDYRNLALASISRFETPLGETEVTLAHNDRPFGADRFYGDFNSWERTRTWFGAVRQPLGKATEVSFAFRRHTDLFVLYRDRPEVFTNRHAVESYQGAVRRRETLGQNGRLHYGVEGYQDSIASTNLGDHTRGRGAGYMAYDVRAIRRFSFTAGAREEVYRGLRHQFSPSAGAGFWISQHLKLRAAASHAFRLPSFTDLYYHDPANLGSPDLRPETAWSYEAGLDWNAGGLVRGEVTVFERSERDGIDYVRRAASDVWRATNFRRLRFTGVEVAVETLLARKHRMDFRYTALRGVQDAVGGAMSRYTFNYPLHSGLAGWQGTLPGGIVARSRFGVVERFARDPYLVWDFYLAASLGRIHPFVQVTNLTDTAYQEIAGIPMPGRGVLAGFEVAVFRRTN